MSGRSLKRAAALANGQKKLSAHFKPVQSSAAQLQAVLRTVDGIPADVPQTDVSIEAAVMRAVEDKENVSPVSAVGGGCRASERRHVR